MENLTVITKKKSRVPRFSSTSQKRAGMNIIKFVAILVILTIIARGVSGATLPTVSITTPSRGEIIKAVSGNAVVSSTDTVGIYAPEGLLIHEMLTGAGRIVDVNEPVALFDIDEVINKLIRETASLDKMLLDLEALENVDTVDSTNLRNQQRQLDRAHEDYNSTMRQANVDTIDSTNLSNQQKQLDRAHEDYNLTVKQANADIAAAQMALNEAIRAQAEFLEKSNLDSTDYSDFDTEDDTDNGITNEPDPDIAREKQAAIGRARDALADAQKKAENDLLQAARRIEDAQVSVQSASLDYYMNQNRRTETAENDLINAKRRIEDAQASVQSASLDYNMSQNRRDELIESNNISATVLQLDIEKQESVVQNLRTLLESDGRIYSDINGLVSESKNNGDTTGKDAILTIKDVTGGFEATMLLDKSDSDMLKIGSECEVTTGGGTMFFNPTVTGTVSAMSPPDDDDVVKVTIKLPPTDWTEGQKVDVTAIIDHAVHDMCLPLSALRSDNTGYFVLITEQRSTVLGVENLVDRVPVIVVASDRDTVSVQGPIGRNTQVITGSGKPISPGDKVRLS